jgi:putative heme iron utilization protein
MTNEQLPNGTFHGQGGTTPTEGPSLAERARTLISWGGNSSLSTMSKKHPGFPFGSLMPYAVDEQGRPMFLISSMAMHTKNLKEEPRCTLLVQRASAGGSPLGSARISVMGKAALIPEDQHETARATYLARHPESKQWAGFGDFALYRLEVVDVYFVGGFGVMGWISAAEYTHASPDPLAQYADDIIKHVNSEHARAVVAIAKHQWGIDAKGGLMTSIDQHGFDAKLLTDQGAKGIRVQFPKPANSTDDVRKIMTQMVKAATGDNESL